MACALVLSLSASARAQDSALDDKSRLSRSLRESLFLNGQLGLRQRSGVYAEGAEPGSDGRTELRVHVQGRYGVPESDPFGAFVDLGAVGTFGAPDTPVGDPFASPYDQFSARNIRVATAFGQYVLRGEDQSERFAVRLGRLSELDPRARLLLFDGAHVRMAFGNTFSFRVYGGRRTTMDGNLPDDRGDFEPQMILGGELVGQTETLRVALGYRFEEAQRPNLRLDWNANDLVRLGLGTEIVLGGRDSVDANNAIAGSEAGVDLAAIVRIDGDLALPSQVLSVSFTTEVQIGQDPTVYGRGGVGPSEAEIQQAQNSPIDQARLDRLFFGPAQPHVLADVLAQYWVTGPLNLSAGGFMRVPLGDEYLRSLQPQVFEVWGGPQLMLSGGLVTGIEGRYSAENPGDPDRLFSLSGDGERSRIAGRVYAELPFALSETVVLALRPEGELSNWTSQGSLSEVSGQLGGAFGLAAAVNFDHRWRASVRYGGEILPPVGNDGLDYVHDIEVWVGGRF